MRKPNSVSEQSFPARIHNAVQGSIVALGEWIRCISQCWQKILLNLKHGLGQFVDVLRLVHVSSFKIKKAMRWHDFISYFYVQYIFILLE